jgi:hypothetical protein
LPVKDDARRAVGIETTPIPIKLIKEVKILPPVVIGTMSPYPTVVIVEIAHHIQANIELNFSGCEGDSKK